MQQLVAVLHSLALNLKKCALNGGKKVCFTTPLPLTFPTNSCKVQIKACVAHNLRTGRPEGTLSVLVGLSSQIALF